MDKLTPIMGKGCLAGFGLVVIFFVISGLAYLAISQFDLPQNLVLLVTVASGPIIGTLGTLAVLLLRSIDRRERSTTDETAARDSS